MKRLRLLTSIFVLGLTALPAFAATDIFWEKERLERTVSERIQSAVKPLVQDGSFGVIVSVTLSRPEKQLSVSSRTDSIDLGKLGGSVDVGTLHVETTEDSERDLGGRIVGINAKLTVPEKLDAARVETIRQTALDILGGFGRFKKDVVVAKNVAFDAPVKEDEAHKTASADSSPPSWPLPVAILLGAVLFAGMASWIANKLLAIESRKVDAMEAQSTAQERSIQFDERENSSSSEPFTAGPGLLRFQSLAERDAAKAADMVRHWVALDTEEAYEALAYIGRYSNLDQLDKTLSYLDDAQKDQWRSAVQSDRDDLNVAERFLRSRAMDSVSNESQGSKDLHTLLFDLTSAECAEVASKSPRDGALLLNALPALQVSRMLSLLPSSAVSELARQSLTLDPSATKAIASEIRQKVLSKRHQSAMIKVPFAQKTPELVRELDFEREQALFDSLIEAGQWETVRKTAAQVFPSQLMARLPAELLKQSLVQLPVAERAELILSAPVALQTVLLNAFGTTGKLRELMDLQIMQMRNDGHTILRIEKQKQSYQRRLGNRIRQSLSASETNQNAADLVIEAWLSEREKGSHARNQAA